MVYNGKDKYDNSDEKNNLGDKLENLINQIDELKDDNKDNDELIGIFEQGSRALDGGLYKELSDCNINILNEIEDKILGIYSEADDLGININVKSSLESLLQIITNIRNTKEKDDQTRKSPENSNQEEKLEKEYKEIGSIWSMNPDDYNKMQKSLGGKAFIKKLEKKGDRYSYSPEKLKSYLNDIKGNDWGGFLKMLDKGKNGNTEEERNENIGKWRAVISAIQILLNEKFPNNPIIVDGKYGTKTKQRVKDFQDSNKLKPDSKPGKNTIDALLGNKIEETSEKDDRADYIIDNATAIKDLTQEQIDNIEKIRNIGFTIYEEDFDLVKDLTQEQIDNIKKIRNIGFIIYVENFDLVKDLTQEQIDNIEIMLKFGIKTYKEAFDLAKDLTQEQIDNIEKIKMFGFDVNIDNIYDLTEFDKADFEILGINSEFLYESYDYTESEIEAHQNYKKGKIIENIEDFIQNVISENRDIGKSEIIEHIRSDLVTLPVKERISIIIGINKSVHKFNTVRKYLDFNNPENEYKTPKNLLCAIRGINDPKIISEITDDITVAQHGVGMMFFVGDEDSYEKIYDPDSSITNLSGGFQCPESDIEELEGTLCVINGVDPNNDTEEYSYGTIRHEGQHNRNTYFMPDRDQGPITCAKDEITAYLRDGRGIFEEEKREETIEQILTQSEDEGGLYQYDLKGEEWEQHKNQIRELLGYANDLIGLTIDPNTGLTRDNIISMLSCVPADQRKILHQNVMNAVKTHTTKELLDKFRRSGTAEKQTEIDEILVANSIEDIKHILSDPKYSHISRVPNNKGGIEISAIIDEVVAGRLAITYIPSEIRQYVQKFIKQ